MKKTMIVCMSLGTVLGLTVSAHAQQSQGQSQSSQSSQGSQSGQQDSRFIEHAAQANLAEVQLGQLAAQKSQNDQVKQFAEHLQTDHQKANQKLQPIAQNQGIQMPQTPNSKEQRQLQQLQGLSGAQFDQQFATTALKTHARTIALFQREAQQGQDASTRQYAQSMLPSLQHHLSMAQDLAKNVGVSDTTISSILSQYPGALGGASAPSGQGQGAGSSSQSGQQQPMEPHEMSK